MKPNITTEELNALLTEESKGAIYQLIQNGGFNPQMVVYSERKYDGTRKRSVCYFQTTIAKDYPKAIKLFVKHMKKDKMREGLDPVAVFYNAIVADARSVDPNGIDAQMILTVGLSTTNEVVSAITKLTSKDKGSVPFGDTECMSATEDQVTIEELTYIKKFYESYYK